MNPLMMIPFILVPLILAATSYLVMLVGLVNAPVTLVPWTMPPIIGPLMATGWDWRAAVWSAIEIVMAVVIYIPFFKVAEKQLLKDVKNSREIINKNWIYVQVFFNKYKNSKTNYNKFIN